MKVVFTKHALEKFTILRKFGWKITRTKVKSTILKPKWSGVSRFGQKTAMTLVDKNHILRVILNQESDTMNVVTFHIARRGTYESTL